MKTAYIYNILKRWGFVAAVLLLIVMNYLSNAIPIGGQTTADISSKYPTLVTPAGYAFAIWGLIYFALALFAYFQLTRGKEVRFYKLIWPYFIANAICNALWLVAFQHEWLGTSLFFMSGLLLTLILIFRIFYRIRGSLSTTHRYFFQIPFSLYFGWVSLATIVNVAVYIQSLDAVFFQNYETIAAIVMVIAAAVLGLIILVAKQDYLYALTIAWASVAIYIAQRDISEIAVTAKFSAIVLLAASAIHFIADRIKVAQYGNSVS